jgi:hypothetical protein
LNDLTEIACKIEKGEKNKRKNRNKTIGEKKLAVGLAQKFCSEDD